MASAMRSQPIGSAEEPVARGLELSAAAAAAERAALASAGGSRRARSVLGRLVLHCFNLVIAAGAFAAYQHFHLEKQSGPALVSLLVAVGFALAPVRALLGELWALESKALHIFHGVGGLALAGLALGGHVTGAPVLSRAALAPFEIMGAAQAIMHQQHPRNARQAEALRRFATSLPEVEQLTSARDLTSPDNAARAARVLGDLISKARALGATELDADPGFQSALREVTTRVGLTLGLDAVDQGIDRLAGQPGTSRQVAELRKELSWARQEIARH
jgi:hypothetical protein